MKTVIVYDSMYGNTEIIARAIGDAISGDIQVLRSNEANAAQLETVDFLIVGAPTQAGRPTPAIQEFLNTLTKSTVKGVNIASFDTRISAKWVGIFGYAAGKIAKNLTSKGAILVTPPKGFFVKGKEGPLQEGELERATRWAEDIKK